MFTRGVPSRGAAGTPPGHRNGVSLITDNDFLGEIRIKAVDKEETVFNFYYAELLHHGRPVHFWKVVANFYGRPIGEREWHYVWYHLAELVSRDTSLEVLLAHLAGPLSVGFTGAFRAASMNVASHQEA